MLKMNERLNLITLLNTYKLDVNLTRHYAPHVLRDFCVGLDEGVTPFDYYKGHLAIQKELVNNEQFFFYLEQMYKRDELTSAVINNFIEIIHSHDDNTSAYSVEQIMSSAIAVANTKHNTQVFYDLLACFSSQFTCESQAEIIASNLSKFKKSLSRPIKELSVHELALFKEKALTDWELLPESEDINRAFHLLSTNDDLLNIIRFFYKNGIAVKLSIDNYTVFSQRPNDFLEKLKVLYSNFTSGYMHLFLLRWKENNCPYYDLDAITNKLDFSNEAIMKEALSSRSGYLNFIYGGRISGIPLSDVAHFQEDVLIYAITNKKNGFLRVIEENYDTFSKLSVESILFRREFYTRYVNINAMNAKNLRDCAWMDYTNVKIDALESDKVYTFDEIKMLYGLQRQYYSLYAHLCIPRVDSRILALKQLSKRKLLPANMTDEHVIKLSVMLSEKPLSLWLAQDFKHIIGLRAQDAVRLLIHWSDIHHLIPQMKSSTDALLLINNPAKIQSYNKLDDVKMDLINLDNSWANLVKKMGFTAEFLHHNHERIIEFLCKNGAAVADVYLNALHSGNHRESLKRIIKAELMGEFNKLKYYADDLQKEIGYPVSDAQKRVWMENTEIHEPNGITVKECDNYHDTMVIGTVPKPTCLSYSSGSYKECLLSNFDSNKKVLYAYKDGEVVGRASIRFTKGRFNEPTQEIDPSLSFVDLEAENASGKLDNTEHLIIFLEYPYSAYIPDDTAQKIEAMYIELMNQKAEAMGAMLVVSGAYSPSVDYVRTHCHVYISKSKAGVQYLDSLNGSAKVSDEGGYRANQFFINKNALAATGTAI